MNVPGPFAAGSHWNEKERRLSAPLRVKPSTECSGYSASVAIELIIESVLLDQLAELQLA